MTVKRDVATERRRGRTLPRLQVVKIRGTLPHAYRRRWLDVQGLARFTHGVRCQRWGGGRVEIDEFSFCNYKPFSIARS